MQKKIYDKTISILVRGYHTLFYTLHYQRTLLNITYIYLQLVLFSNCDMCSYCCNRMIRELLGLIGSWLSSEVEERSRDKDQCPCS